MNGLRDLAGRLRTSSSLQVLSCFRREPTSCAQQFATHCQITQTASALHWQGLSSSRLCSHRFITSAETSRSSAAKNDVDPLPPARVCQAWCRRHGEGASLQRPLVGAQAHMGNEPADEYVRLEEVPSHPSHAAADNGRLLPDSLHDTGRSSLQICQEKDDPWKHRPRPFRPRPRTFRDALFLSRHPHCDPGARKPRPPRTPTLPHTNRACVRAYCRPLKHRPTFGN